MGAFVEFENVSKIYKTGDVEVHALTDASFEIQKGEFCVIVGESGAGKTTLLNILGGMDTLSKGTVRMDGRDISHFNRTQLENYRRYDIGFVFQFYNLIPNLTALENVEIAAQLCTDAIPAEALDYETGKSILKLLQDTCRRDGMTVVIITHNAALAAMADRIIRVKSGHIYSVRMNEHITPVEQIEW